MKAISHAQFRAITISVLCSVEAGICNATGDCSGFHVFNTRPSVGALYSRNGWNESIGNARGTGTYTHIYLDLSLSNPIYGNSETVTPESMSCKFFIRY